MAFLWLISLCCERSISPWRNFRQVASEEAGRVLDVEMLTGVTWAGHSFAEKTGCLLSILD